MQTVKVQKSNTTNNLSDACFNNLIKETCYNSLLNVQKNVKYYIKISLSAHFTNKNTYSRTSFTKKKATIY